LRHSVLLNILKSGATIDKIVFLVLVFCHLANKVVNIPEHYCYLLLFIIITIIIIAAWMKFQRQSVTGLMAAVNKSNVNDINLRLNFTECHDTTELHAGPNFATRPGKGVTRPDPTR